MSEDRTDAVIEAIDHALEDWSVSGDAMRWNPEPPETESVSEGQRITIFFDSSSAVVLPEVHWTDPTFRPAMRVVDDIIQVASPPGEWLDLGRIEGDFLIESVSDAHRFITDV